MADVRRVPAAGDVGRLGVVRWTAAGLTVGAGYGAALRAWMRLVSTDPEFSWGGTGYIVGVFAVVGAMAGLVSAGRRLGWGRPLVALRCVGVVLSLGCFVAAGITMLPTIVPGALGWARSDWPRPVRAGLIVVAVGSAAAVVLGTLDIDLPRRLLALALYLPLCAVEVAMIGRFYAPSLPRGRAARWTKPALIVIGALLVVGLGVLVRGVGG